MSQIFAGQNTPNKKRRKAFQTNKSLDNKSSFLKAHSEETIKVDWRMRLHEAHISHTQLAALARRLFAQHILHIRF
jgi:hypothetical protein